MGVSSPTHKCLALLEYLPLWYMTQVSHLGMSWELATLQSKGSYMKQKVNRPRRWTLRKLIDAAKIGGIFVFEHKDRIEYMSKKTGKCVLTWWWSDGGWTAAQDRRGFAQSPFGALHEAIAIDRGQR